MAVGLSDPSSALESSTPADGIHMCEMRDVVDSEAQENQNPASRSLARTPHEA